MSGFSLQKRRDAVQRVVRASLRAAMIPTVNGMMIAPKTKNPTMKLRRNIHVLTGCVTNQFTTKRKIKVLSKRNSRLSNLSTR